MERGGEGLGIGVAVGDVVDVVSDVEGVCAGGGREGVEDAEERCGVLGVGEGGGAGAYKCG